MTDRPKDMARDIEDAVQRIVQLNRRLYAAPPESQALLQNALNELTTLAERLEQSSEELRIQNDEFLTTNRAFDEELSRLRSLFDSAPFAYIVTNSDGIILDANAAALKTLRLSAYRILGRPLATLVPLEERRVLRRRITDCSRGIAVLPWQMTLATRSVESGTYTVTCSTADGGDILWSFHPAPASPLACSSTTESGSARTLPNDLVVALWDSPSVETLLHGIIREYVPSQCDFTLIELFGQSSTLVRCAVVHVDVVLHQRAARLLSYDGREFPRGVDSDSFQTPSEQLLSAITDNAREQSVWRSLRLQSIYRASLVYRDEVIGAITLGWGRPSPRPVVAVEVLRESVHRVGSLLGRALDFEALTAAVGGAAGTVADFKCDMMPVLNALAGHAEQLRNSGNAGIVRNVASAESIHDGVMHARALLDRMGGVGTPRQGDAAAVAAALRDVAVLMSPIAAARSVTLQILSADVGHVAASSEDLRRIVVFLLNRAIEHADSGTVAVSASIDGSSVTIALRVGMPDAVADEEDRPIVGMREHVTRLGGELVLDPNGSARLRLPRAPLQ